MRLKEVMVSWMTLWLASEHVGRSFAHEALRASSMGGLSDAEVGQPGSGSRWVLGGKKGYEKIIEGL